MILDHVTEEANPQLNVRVQVAHNGPHNVFTQISLTQELFRIIPFPVYAHYRVFLIVDIEEREVNGFALTNVNATT